MWQKWLAVAAGESCVTAASCTTLASAMAEWVTGTTVHVDGGALAWLASEKLAAMSRGCPMGRCAYVIGAGSPK